MGDRLFDLCGQRMTTAYQEQVWAVAMVGGVNGFVASQAPRLEAAFGLGTAATAVAAVSLLALLFVWSRHAIYVHYDRIAVALVAADGERVPRPDRVPARRAAMARLSGVALYSILIMGMAVVAIKLLAVAACARGM